MKFLITGASGQLGQAFIQFFENKGLEYIAAGHDILDITNIENVTKFIQENPIDFIVNCGAYNNVDEAEKQWKKANLVNGIGPKNLALISNDIDATLIHYSTDYVFDGEKKTPYTILDNPKPISRYGESKLLGEKNTKQIANRYYLIRVSWLFGKGGTNFVQKVIEWSKRKSVLKVVDDQISSPTYTADIVKATYNLIQTRAYGLYHISNSSHCSRYEWAKFILDKIGWKGNLKKGKSEDFNTPARRPKFSVLDNSGTKKIIKYSLPEWKHATDSFLKIKGN